MLCIVGHIKYYVGKTKKLYKTIYAHLYAKNKLRIKYFSVLVNEEGGINAADYRKTCCTLQDNCNSGVFSEDTNEWPANNTAANSRPKWILAQCLNPYAIKGEIVEFKLFLL